MMSADGRNDPDREKHPWLEAYYGNGTFFLAAQAFRRVAQYQRSIANLTREGSVEPRLWIGALQSFWSGMASDYGDFLRRYGGRRDGAEPIAATAKGPLIVPVPIRIAEGSKTHVQSIDVPENLFDGSVTKARLVTDGLFLGTRCLLRPKIHLDLTPEITSREEDFKLHFFNLPDELTAGMTLLGTVVAHRECRPPSQVAPANASGVPLEKVLVAILQAKIF
jgi:hypothetical protein